MRLTIVKFKLSKLKLKLPKLELYCLLLILSLVFEELFQKQLISILLNENLISDHQFSSDKKEKVHLIMIKPTGIWIQNGMFVSFPSLLPPQTFVKMWQVDLLYKTKSKLPQLFWSNNIIFIKQILPSKTLWRTLTTWLILKFHN